MSDLERQPGSGGGGGGRDLVGTVLAGKYRVVRRIGGGAVADVYEAVHERIGGRVALKILRREFARFPDISRRFLNEARAAGAAGHPGIVQVFDLGQLDGGELFMVMELLQGEDLGSLLMRQGRLPVPRAAGIAVQLLEALEAAHRAGVIHRDLKPENVLILRGPGGEDWIKVIDFGIARLTQDGPTALRRTAEGSVLGSPYYMSPEQARGDADLDVRTDIHAVGVMLYEMLAAQLPYTGLSIAGIVERVLHDPFPNVRDVVAAVPEDLERVILKATARRREERFASAAEFAAAARPFRGEPGAQPPAPRRDLSPLPVDFDDAGEADEDLEPGGVPRRPRVIVPARVYLVAVAAAVVAAILVVGLVSLLGRDDTAGRAPPAAAAPAVDASSPPAADATTMEADAVAGFTSPDAPSTAVSPEEVVAPVDVGPDALPDREPSAAADAVVDAPAEALSEESTQAARDAGRDEGAAPRDDGGWLTPGPDAGLDGPFDDGAAPPPGVDAGTPEVEDRAPADGPDAGAPPLPVDGRGDSASGDASMPDDIGFAPNPFRG